MAHIDKKFVYLPSGLLDVQAWVNHIQTRYAIKNTDLLIKAALFSQKLVQGLTTFYGRTCLEQGLEVAEVLFALKLDQETAAAGIIIGSISQPIDEMIRKEVNESVAKLVAGVGKTNIITDLQTKKSGNPIQIDKIRKMLLAMATDIRVVMIKLAERMTIMRGIKSIPLEDQQRFAQEIMDIYAPLANRLGIGQIKWELEDLAFRYQHPDIYKNIATYLAERRSDRERRIQELIDELNTHLKATDIKKTEITGRAKHIYSIYLKMQRKDVPQKDIYDHSAIRILVPTIENCYQVLSIVNSLWPPIMAEFDDYIAHPKPNGYQSIHTAVIGKDGKHFEIQIRTFTMHEESERGIAAHWLYKEGDRSVVDDRTKISYLRQLIDWHQELSETKDTIHPSTLDPQVYVITPAGDILDLPQGATPIDFAYYIHSELGHRCRGAKVNGHIVPLSYTLRTGDKIDIHTIAEGHPSRDWLNVESGYVKTSRARSKINHWFKQQELNQDIAAGREQLERELSRSGLAKSTSLIDLAKYFHLKNEDELFAAIGRNTLRISQIMHSLQPKAAEKTLPPPLTISPTLNKTAGSAIVGAADLLTRYAKCCKPIPGDAIFGYITQASGISIHKKNCKNAANFSNPARFIEIAWNQDQVNEFVTDLKIVAQNQEKALHDLTALFVNEKIKLLSFNFTAKKHHEPISILVTVQIRNIEQLKEIKHRIQQLPSIIDVMRVKK